MRTIYLLLFPLFLFFIVSCTEDEVDPNFSIENVGDVVMGSAKGSQVTISFTSTREWKASTVAGLVYNRSGFGRSGYVQYYAYCYQ